MINQDYRFSENLMEHDNKFEFLTKLYSSNNFPNVLMLTGDKGIGKSTLIHHFLNFIYDKKGYDLKNKIVNFDTNFNNQYLNKSFPNVIYMNGDLFKNIKIDDIRQLKTQLSKTTILDMPRFIILDGVELFNINSLNALLKMIEEPSADNFFILINNKIKKLVDTIHSRALEIKIFLNNISRIKVIEYLLKKNNIKVSIDYKSTSLSPGIFLFYNEIVNDLKIDINSYLLDNIEKTLQLFKKNKNTNLIGFLLFLTDYHFKNLKERDNLNFEKILECKSYVNDNINKFFTYNLNQTSLINILSNKLSNG